MMKQVASPYPFTPDGIAEYPIKPVITEVCCLNIGHDFFAEVTRGKDEQLVIICRKCGEVRKVD